MEFDSEKKKLSLKLRALASKKGKKSFKHHDLKFHQKLEKNFLFEFSWQNVASFMADQMING